MTDTLNDLRDRIRAIDLELIALAAARVALGRQVGDAKRRENIGTVDYAQERVVIDRARAAAGDAGLSPHVAEELFATLIQASVLAQDLDNQRRAAVGAGKRAVVIGGAGRMGQWLVRFLETLGYTAGSLDPAASADENAWAQSALRTADLVICSAPPTATAALYLQWAADPPQGVIADIASIKTPLIEPIQALRRAGARVASFHPMFGPSIVLLRDCDVVICDTGDIEATAAIDALFAPTMARVLHLPLAEHDRVMADVLSLAHATVLAFATALPERKPEVRSTTLRALERLAANIVRESPDVYYEIQAENPFSLAAITRLRDAVDRVIGAVHVRDPKGFHELLRKGRERT